MKKLLLNVNCITPECTTGPSHFVVSLSTDLINRIKFLSQEMISLNLCQVNMNFVDGIFVSSDDVKTVISKQHLDINSIEPSMFVDIERLKGFTYLIIQPNAFYFTFIPKKMNHAFTHKSDSIPLSELENLDTHHCLSLY